MFSASFTGTDQRATAELLNKGPKMITMLVRSMNLWARKLQTHIQVDKLSGQVLHQRTAKGRNSIRVIDATAEGSALYAEVLGGGGVAPYMALHEYGGDGPYIIRPTNKKALRFMMGSRVVFATKVLHPPMPQRSFMRSSLADMQAEIAAGLQAALDQGSK